MIIGCYLVEVRLTILYNYLLLLLFELGQSKSVFRVCLYSPNQTAVVVLTIKKGYKDCAFSTALTRSGP